MLKKSVLELLLVPFLAFMYIHTYGQCHIKAYGNGVSDTLTICLGESVNLSATGGCPTYVLYSDFNDATAGVGWFASSQAMFTNPCPPHSPDGTIYLWMGSSSAAPRFLESNDFDVSQGGTINFEMRYEVQVGQSWAAPCEGPDLYNEGVVVQYSTNGGITWNDIIYYAPNGDILSSYTTATQPSVGAGTQTQFTVWDTYTVPIPSSAETPSTRFRWHQPVSTADIWDHWGLDNVTIAVPPPTVEVWWSHTSYQGFTPPPVTPVGDTIITVTITDGTDTTSSDLYIRVNPIPTSDFTATPEVCVGEPATITYTGSASASANYGWNFAGGSVISGSGQGPYEVFWQQPGTYDLTLTLIENDCESEQTTVPITVNPKPSGPVLSYDSPCEGQDLLLYADTIPGATYTWSGPAGFSSNQQNPVVPNATTANEGTYTAYITDDNNCVSDLSSIAITIIPLPDVTFNAQPMSGCQPLTVDFNVTTPNVQSFMWEFGDGSTNDTDMSPSHEYVNDGSYSVRLTVTDDNGCTNDFINNNMIAVHPIPKVDFTTNPEVGSPGYEMTFNSSYTTTGSTWYWDYGDGSPLDILNVPTSVHAFSDMGNYEVLHIVESEFGCKDSVSKNILIIDITIPNVFTPNGDGLNDYFVIDGIEQISGTHLVVFNRWGKKVFESHDYQNDWGGEGQADGVYYYVITFRDNLFEPINGTVTILR